MTKTITITFDGKDYEIGVLPVGVLRAIDGEFSDAPDPKLNAKEVELFNFDRAIAIICEGLKMKDPTMTVDKIYCFPCTMGEIIDAKYKILRLAGLVKDKDPASGEGEAGASAT